MTDTGEPEQSEIIDPAALTTMFDAQRQATLQQVDRARIGMAHVKATLEQLAQFPASVEAADTAWTHLKPVRQVLKQIDAVMAGAAQVITTVIDQRDSVAQEMKELTQAIRVEDIDHPQLKQMAESVRRNAYAEGFSDGEDATEYDYDSEAWDYGETDFEDGLAAKLADQWGVTNDAAHNFIWAIRGEGDITDEQREAFQALLSTF